MISSYFLIMNVYNLCLSIFTIIYFTFQLSFKYSKALKNFLFYDFLSSSSLSFYAAVCCILSCVYNATFGGAALTRYRFPTFAIFAELFSL